MLSQAVYTTTVGELMNTEVLTLLPNDTMDKARDLFNQHRIHHIPVADETGKLVGMLSKMDYFRILNSFMLFDEKRNNEINAMTLRSLLVKDIMSKQVASIQPEDGLLKAVGIFKENLFHALPVVDAEKKLQGILTSFDLLIFAYRETAE